LNKFELYESREVGLAKVGNEIKTYKKGFTALDYTPWLFRHVPEDKKHLMELPPCTFGEPLIEYFNSEEVKTKLHIRTDLASAWDMCTSAANWRYSSDYEKGSEWIYSQFKADGNKYKILFYSGDTDGAVSTYGTLGWINALNWEVTEAWRPYTIVD
jgi:hypothetical protein